MKIGIKVRNRNLGRRGGGENLRGLGFVSSDAHSQLKVSHHHLTSSIVY
jgi:hypothetical protein